MWCIYNRKVISIIPVAQVIQTLARSFNDFTAGQKFPAGYEKLSELFRPIQIAWHVINDRQHFRNRAKNFSEAKSTSEYLSLSG